MKTLRRWWLNRRHAYWQREVRELDEQRLTLGSQADFAIRQLNAARMALVMLDVQRPPITRVIGAVVDPRRPNRPARLVASQGK